MPSIIDDFPALNKRLRALGGEDWWPRKPAQKPEEAWPSGSDGPFASTSAPGMYGFILSEET